MMFMQSLPVKPSCLHNNHSTLVVLTSPETASKLQKSQPASRPCAGAVEAHQALRTRAPRFWRLSRRWQQQRRWRRRWRQRQRQRLRRAAGRNRPDFSPAVAPAGRWRRWALRRCSEWSCFSGGRRGGCFAGACCTGVLCTVCLPGAAARKHRLHVEVHRFTGPSQMRFYSRPFEPDC